MTGKLTLSILAAAALTFGAAAKEVKLLTIGNSFADSAFKFLPKVAESAGDKVIMDRANIGGCPARPSTGSSSKSPNRTRR